MPKTAQVVLDNKLINQLHIYFNLINLHPISSTHSSSLSSVTYLPPSRLKI